MTFFDLTAPVYDFFALSAKRTVKYLLTLTAFSPTDKILDIGGGTGRIAELLKPVVGQIAILDPSAKMIKRCRRRPDLVCVLGQVEALPFPDNHFDKILLVDAFHHFPDQTQALKEIIRVLKPDGQIIGEEFDPAKFFGRLIELAEIILRFNSCFHQPTSLINFFAQQNLKTTITQDGFRYYFKAIILNKN